MEGGVMAISQKNLGYPDLTDEQFVYNALLGHGMFNEKLPPCFSSEFLLKFTLSEKDKKAFYKFKLFPFQYQSYRNTNVPRMFSIPHPLAYLNLCEVIKKHWQKINEHTGKPALKFSDIHVRKFYAKNQALEQYIFKMNPNDYGKWERQEVEHLHLLGCKYVVKADISTFFPSIYSHSITWAVYGTWTQVGNSNRWGDKLDKACMTVNGRRTTGFPIGPHTSNILSEIILTAVDKEMQEKGFKKVVRRIDDYTFYAENEKMANEFLRSLQLILQKYELHLNVKKTKIIPINEYIDSCWTSKLNQYNFNTTYSEIGFTYINNFIEYALNIATQEDNYAVLNYAFKIVSGKTNLSLRAKRLYINKALGLAIQYPYLLPILEEFVFDKFFDLQDNKHREILEKFVVNLLHTALEYVIMDALAFCFYYAIKYDIVLDNNFISEALDLQDCVSMTLAYEYAKRRELCLKKFKNKAQELHKRGDIFSGQYWLFIYQALEENEYRALNPSNDIPQFMQDLKAEGMSFVKLI